MRYEVTLAKPYRKHPRGGKIVVTKWVMLSLLDQGIIDEEGAPVSITPPHLKREDR